MKIKWIDGKYGDSECIIGSVLMNSQGSFRGYLKNGTTYRPLLKSFETSELAQQAVIDAEVEEIKRRLEQVDLLQWLNLPVVEDGNIDDLISAGLDFPGKKICSDKCPCYGWKLDKDYPEHEFSGEPQCPRMEVFYPENYPIIGKPHPDCIAACEKGGETD
jgi:hypothetical protein